MLVSRAVIYQVAATLSVWHLAPLVTAKAHRKSMKPLVFMVLSVFGGFLLG